VNDRNCIVILVHGVPSSSIQNGGFVRSIFTSPSSTTTRHLVFPPDSVA